MRNLVTIKFGSHLYGTSTPTSDLDFKSVHVPDARQIILQRAKGSSVSKRPKAEFEKNVPTDVDEESYSLQRYLELVAQGQTVALDVLFAPRWSMPTMPAEEWFDLIDNRRCLLTKKSAAFLGYCRQQANKYGIKGSRVAAARKALTMLEGMISSWGNHDKLGSFAQSIEYACNETEHMSVVEIKQVGGQVIKYWDVCGRKLGYTTTTKHARDVIQILVDEYGKRALLAESNQGVDWKALSHAVRVGNQAIELLETHKVTFPLWNAEHILDIKLGKLSYQEVSEEIEELLVRVEDASSKSSLPEEPDRSWIDQFVMSVYGREVWNHLREAA